MSQPKECSSPTPPLPSEEEVLAVIAELDGFDKYSMAELIVKLRKAASSEIAPTTELQEALIKRDALHLVVSALAGKLMLDNLVLIDMLQTAEEELRAKRWLS